MPAVKKPATKKPRVRKSRAKAAPAAAATSEPVPNKIPQASPPPEGKAASRIVFEGAAMVGRNADQHTRDTKRQKAIVDVVLSMAAINLQNMADSGGELAQVGVTWANGEEGLVPYNEIVAAFVAQAPYLAESIKVDDPR